MAKKVETEQFTVHIPCDIAELVKELLPHLPYRSMADFFSAAAKTQLAIDSLNFDREIWLRHCKTVKKRISDLEQI